MKKERKLDIIHLAEKTASKVIGAHMIKEEKRENLPIFWQTVLSFKEEKGSFTSKTESHTAVICTTSAEHKKPCQ